MGKYSYLKRQYSAILTLDEMRKILHISKRKASYMLKNGYIPCKDSGKKTRNFRIKLKDVIFYLEDVDKHPEKYTFPNGAFSSKSPNKCAEWGSALPTEEFRLWLEDMWYNVPDAMTITELTQLTGYASTTYQNWISEGKIKSISHYNKIVIAKEWLIDFYCKDGFAIIRRSKEHQKMLGSFSEECGVK